MRRKTIAAASLLAAISLTLAAQDMSQQEMERIYEEVKTPYKYGMVVAPQDNYHKYDCPTVFRKGDEWYMTYVCYDGKDGTDGRGYETWLAKSDDLLHWQTLGRILALPASEQGLWDQNQRGGFPALVDHEWGGSYAMQPYKGRHYLTYIGGPGTGYEAVHAPLSIGLATTTGDIATAHQWDTQPSPLMSYDDNNAQWWEQLTQYKSTVYWLQDKQQRLKGEKRYPFVMFYNAGGKDDTHPKGERIGIALSKDMKHWKRYRGNPVFAHDSEGTITGDAQIAYMGHGESPLWVMFYFSAYNPSRPYNAFNTFAASRDLVHWQDWTGPDLIAPSKPYDEMFAHKSYVVKHDGVAYHFYCAVNHAGQRGIALATSAPMGRSDVRFPQPEPVGRRVVTPLNEGWRAFVVGRDSAATTVNLPHNFDDYYGYRQLRHGNLHGQAIYQKTFLANPVEGHRYFLQMEGIGTYATVTLNDTQYPRELVGRTVWTLDVTEALCTGKNTLHIVVDHPPMLTDSPWICGGCSSEWGFSEGSQPFGIFRPVTLVETDEVRVEPFGVHVWNNAACDTLFIDTEVRNYSEQTLTVELVQKLAGADGKQVFRLAEPQTLAAGETRVLHHRSPMADPHRWSPADPYLYTLTTMLKRSGKTTDDVHTSVGVRSLSWPRSGGDTIATHTADHRFRINGEPFFINGTCEYEHLLGASHAFSHEQIASRIKQIRWCGFNALREAHQPHNLYYQQLADEQGLLFWSQFSAHVWYDTPQFRQNFRRLLVRWVKERRNSPSVILWGLQNESVLPRDVAEECASLIRQLDPTASSMRLITTCNGGEGTDWNVIQNWSGTYGGSPDSYADELQHPDQLLNGEYGAWRTLDLHGADKYSEESAATLLQKKGRLAEQAYASDSGVCGHFQWLFASHDNPGRVQPDGALRRIDKIGPINHKGLATIWEEPTTAYYNNLTPNPIPEQGSSTRSLSPKERGVHRNSAEGSNYLYRINCGGDSYTDEYGQQWQADDSLLSHSWGQDFEGVHPYQASQRHITTDIRGTQSDELFQYFRFGRHRLWYDLPVPDGDYRLELYFVEPWHGRHGGATDDFEGLRIFDVAVNDSLIIDNFDPWAEAGYCRAIKRVASVKATGGRLRITFPEVKAGQAVICAIAVAAASSSSEESAANSSLFTFHSSLSTFNHQLSPSFWHALDVDTIAKLPRELLPPDSEARPATIYAPQKPRAGQPTTFVVRPGLGQEYALRFRYKNTTGRAVTARLTMTDTKRTTLVCRDITFPPTPDKFKMLSTTTGTQINAGTYTITIDGTGLEFKEMEMQ